MGEKGATNIPEKNDKPLSSNINEYKGIERLGVSGRRGGDGVREERALLIGVSELI